MSPERVQLDRPPSALHLIEGDLDQALARLLERERAAARSEARRTAEEAARSAWLQRFDAELERLAAARDVASA